jgi:hypothetical protein
LMVSHFSKPRSLRSRNFCRSACAWRGSGQPVFQVRLSLPLPPQRWRNSAILDFIKARRASISSPSLWRMSPPLTGCLAPSSLTYRAFGDNL